MRKSLKLLATATLLLPGCILVADGGWDDEDHPFRSNRKLEDRVAALEAQMAACKASCTMPCCTGEAEGAQAPTAEPAKAPQD